MPKPADFVTAPAYRREFAAWRLAHPVRNKNFSVTDLENPTPFGARRRATRLEKLQNWYWIKKRRWLRRKGYSAMSAENRLKHGELGGKLFRLRQKIAGMTTVDSYRPVGSRDPIGYVPDNPKVKSVK